MHWESAWLGIATGASIALLGWIVGLGRTLWPEHPQWALFFVMVAVTAVSAGILERNARREIRRAQN